MPKVLFVAHGMGDNLPGWSKDLVDFLDVALSQYTPFDTEQQPFRKHVKVEELCYDPVFDKTIEPWGRSKESWNNGRAITGSSSMTR